MLPSVSTCLHYLKQTPYWVGQFLWRVAVILIVGTLVGALAFMLFGGLFSDYELLFLLKKGAWAGFRYAGVWAGGLALVLCIIKAFGLRVR